jgi:hypothetical protein
MRQIQENIRFNRKSAIVNPFTRLAGIGLWVLRQKILRGGETSSGVR